MLTAIIVAGGSSQRMGFDKTFAVLAGRPVIAHSVRAFAEADCVREIILVGRAERLGDLRAVAEEAGLTKVRAVLAGGAQRQDSVAAGLAALAGDCRFVAVHDAARPLITPEQIARVFSAAEKHGGAALAAPVADTLKRADAAGAVCGAIDRENVYAMQTPQIFARDLLLEAYAEVTREKVAITDEVSACERLGRPVMLVRNDAPNLKITFPADLALAEAWLSGCSPSRAVPPGP